MKLQTTFAAVALAFVGTAASAATVGTLYDLPGSIANPTSPPALANGGTLSPDPYTSYITDAIPNYTSTYDYVYNFALNTTGDVNVAINNYSGPAADGTGSFALYSGTSTGGSGTSATIVGSSFSFADTIIQPTFSNVLAGSYFLEVKGTPSGVGTSINFVLTAPSETPPALTVPEPTNMALLLAGLGLMGFMAKRRARD